MLNLDAKLKSTQVMVTTGKLTNLQQELLKLYAQQVSETDLQNIRELIGRYFADRLTSLADKAWSNRDGLSKRCTIG